MKTLTRRRSGGGHGNSRANPPCDAVGTRRYTPPDCKFSCDPYG